MKNDLTPTCFVPIVTLFSQLASDFFWRFRWHFFPWRNIRTQNRSKIKRQSKSGESTSDFMTSQSQNHCDFKRFESGWVWCSVLSAKVSPPWQMRGLVNLADLERKQSERPTSVLRMIHVTYVYIVSCISEMGWDVTMSIHVACYTLCL